MPAGLLVTAPMPLTLTLRLFTAAALARVKVAVQVVSATRLKGAPQLAGVQPARAEPSAAVAFGITRVPAVKRPPPSRVPLPLPSCLRLS